MEREVAATRTGATARDGAVAQVDVRGLIATAFDHYDSRAGDPHLHTQLIGALYAAGAGTNEISTAPAGALRTGLLVTSLTTGIVLVAAVALALLSNRAHRPVEEP